MFALFGVLRRLFTRHAVCGKESPGRRTFFPALLMCILLAHPVFAADEALPDEELAELILALLPQSWEGWLGTVVAICAILAAILPRPAKNAHPVLKVCHRLVCCLGLGAGRLKGRTGTLVRLGQLFRRKA